jgi:Bacterial PH domain
MVSGLLLRDGESVVVQVTPLPRGLVPPLIATVAAFAAVVTVATTWSWAGAHALTIALLVVGPCAVVLGMRTWGWRSHKIVVTTERVMTTGGVSNRRQQSVDLLDVVGIIVDQRWHERVMRRGRVVLETVVGRVPLERVRRPDSLWRVIDHQRRQMDRTAVNRPDEAERARRAFEAGEMDQGDHDTRWRHLFGP